MGVIAKNKNQNKLFYNSKNALGKQTFAYVQDTKVPLLTIDTNKENITGTQWIEIAEGLGLKVANLIDQNHSDFIKEYGEVDLVMEESSWLKILSKRPEFVRKPILLKGTKFHFIETPSKITEFTE